MAEKDTAEKILAAGAAGVGAAAGIATGVASTMLFYKTVPRPKGTSQDIIEEFADADKMAEYAKRMEPVGVWMESVPKEDVFIYSDDGLKLHAFYIPSGKEKESSGKEKESSGKEKESSGEEKELSGETDISRSATEETGQAGEKTGGEPRKLVILHHGFTSHAVDNASHAKFFHDEGYDVFLLDLRAHGESEGEYVGFGILDRFDTRRWIEYAKARFGGNLKIVLHGTSMGAATVLMALGIREIEENVSAVIADCAYTSPADVFSHVMKKNYHVPVTGPIISLTSMLSKKAAGYRFDEYSTLDAMKSCRVPVLFIHGKEDKFVPTWMSMKNFEACAARRKELLMVENAGHGSSIFEDTKLYEDTEREFLKDI